MPTARAARFLSRLRDQGRAEALASDALDVALGRVLADARTAWPELELDDEIFVEALAERLPEGVPLDEALRDARAGDLYLACACARGDPAGIAAFEQRHFVEIDAVLARVRDASLSPDDLRQTLREKLFVRARGAAPKIAEYSGRGALGAWFRVAAMRTALNMLRGPKEVPIDGDMLFQRSAGPRDAELEILKQRYRADFRAAFAQAVRALSPRERNLLRYAFVDGLGSDEMATIYGVHKTTVNRWLTDLRAALFSGVRDAMVRDLRISRKELESILRLIQSQIDVTLDGTSALSREKA